MPTQERTIIEPQVFQREFFDTKARFPAIISGVGTGKTYFGLLKVMDFCKKNKNARALVVRKEFTDLRDSTVKDFVLYFGIEPDSNKEVTLPNGSVIMFRHGDELNVLKNITLDIVFIEQAEEFETEEKFIFLRDRLRGKAGPIVSYQIWKGKSTPVHQQQLCVIANANGHNWIWNLWINKAQKVVKLTSDTCNKYVRKEEVRGLKIEYMAITATTFDNADNLDPAFLADMMLLEKEAPNHYLQYVMNDFEVLEDSDLLMKHRAVYDSPNLLCPIQGSLSRVLGVDVARYGDDEIVLSVLESRNLMFWEQTMQSVITQKDQKSIPDTAARILDLHEKLKFEAIAVDDIGVGGGVTDLLAKWNLPVIAFNSNETEHIDEHYFNKRAHCYFYLKHIIEEGNLKIMSDEMLKGQLMSIKFGYSGNKNQKYIWSKERMRKDGLKSPDRADALMIAASLIDNAFDKTDLQAGNLPRYGVADGDVVHERPGMPRYAIND